MKISTVFIALILLFSISCINSQVLPSKDTLMKQMVTANQYFMDKWPDPGEDIVTDRSRPSNLWTRATYYEGLMALYYINPDTNYYNYAVEWGESHDWEPTYGNLWTRDGDHQCCGQTYIELYNLNPQPERIEPIKTCMDNMVNSDKIDDWSWIDAIQMAMPVFAKLGVVYSDTAYFNKMHNMYMFSKTQHGGNGLYNTDEHLWWRDRDFDPPYVTPNGKNCYWSRGNGWVLAALARVLDVLPDTSEYKNEYITTFTEMSAALIEIQREDGFWNSSLTDPDDYGGKETSGTAFFTFGIAWGINKGILDSATYTPHVIKAWNGMAYEALHPSGFLGYMQSTGKQPSDGQPLSFTKEPNFEDYGLGAFLLAGSEVYHLAPETGDMMAFNPDFITGPTEPEDTTDITGPSDIEIQNTNSDLDIFPNPASSTIHINFSMANSGYVKVTVSDVKGNQHVDLFDQYLQSGKQNIELNISALPDGLYIAKVDYHNSSRYTKFLVHRSEL